MTRLKIGVMGVASIAKRLVVPAIMAMPDEFELVAVASRSAQKANVFANSLGCEAIEGYDGLVSRADIDVVYMPLPTGLHEEWVLKCLSAGKHVLVEKSLAVDIESARKMVSMARSKGLLLMENFMFQYHSQHDIAWKLQSEGRLGEIRLFTARFGFPPLDKSTFRYNSVLGGGALLDAGAYAVKASRWFLQSELTVNAATMYVDSKSGVDIYGNATLANSSGLEAQISYGFDNFYQCFYELWGSKGKVRLERAFTPKPDEKPLIIVEQQGVSEKLEMPADNHFVNLLRQFYKSVTIRDFDLRYREVLEQSSTITQIRDKAKKILI